jgi:hypothetical protein
VCQDVLEHNENDPNIMNSIIMCDGTWIFVYDPGTKAQSSQWKNQVSLQSKKAQLCPSKVKTVLIIFFDSSGIFYYKFTCPR